MSKKTLYKNQKTNIFYHIKLFYDEFLRKSLSQEIGNFVKYLKVFIGNSKLTGFSKSAFVQCRNIIRPKVITG